MVTEKLKQYAVQNYEQSLKQLGKKAEEIRTYMEQVSGEEEVLMKFLYGTMPFADAADYEPALFHEYVKHGLYLREHCAFTKHIPEEIFLNYVLYYRVNNEDIVNCRPWFYEQLKERIKGLSSEEAIKEINYWCAEHATYAASDERTLNPLTVYKSITARCGEESTFLVSVLRSVGIPARQVYTPRWAHCDDNHAWVEAFDGNSWRFLGACEPEEILDKGWFTNASSRAMLIHTRVFSDYTSDETSMKEEVTGTDGAVIFHNDTAVYAKTTALTVVVQREDGTKVQNARVQFELMNMAEFYPISTLYTDEDGQVEIELGQGTVQIYCSYKEEIGLLQVNTGETKEVTVCLKEKTQFLQEEEEKQWQFLDLIAPNDYPMHPNKLTKEQKEFGRSRKQKADQMRKEKQEQFYLKEEAKKYEDSSEIVWILKNAFGNFKEIDQFLQVDQNPYRLKLLKTLAKKDYRDIEANVLEEHLKQALQVKEQSFSYIRGTEEEQEHIFVQYVMNPRIRAEMIRPYRETLSACFSEEEKEAWRANPKLIWKYIKERVVTTKRRNYETVITSPVGTLMSGQGSEQSMKTLFVAICRTIGIPARMNPVNLDIEYFKNDAFVPADIKVEEQQQLVPTTFVYDGEKKPAYFVTWTIGKLEEKDNYSVFETLDYTEKSFDGQQVMLELPKGYYRVYTTIRIPNGNQMAAVKYFAVQGTEQSITSEFLIREPKTEDMLETLELEPFTLKEEDGREVEYASITKGKTTLLAFLEVGMEPTEHVLNELKENIEVVKAQNWNIVFVLKTIEDLNNETLKSVCSLLPDISIYYDDFKELPETVARRMYTDPEKLPLLTLTTGTYTGRYACSGYNVGTIELLSNIIGIL